jgi:hypothetical protein
MDDDNIEEFGKAFFIEMLSRGIALKKDGYDINFLVEEIVNRVCIDHDFDGQIDEGPRIRFYTSSGIPILGLLYENDRLVFTMPGEIPDSAMANKVTDILFSVCHVCIDKDAMEIRVPDEQKPNPAPVDIAEEEDFNCDDDFII